MIRTGLVGRRSVLLLALALALVAPAAATGSDEPRESYDAVYIQLRRSECDYP